MIEVSTKPILETDGFQVLDRSLFCIDETSVGSHRSKVLSAADQHELESDQPGCVRRYLDSVSFLSSIMHWLANPHLEQLLTDYFRSHELAVHFIRYREPRKRQGLQDWHIDWKEGTLRERVEVFIALDDIHAGNGCTQIRSASMKHPYDAVMSAGSVLVMDSTIYHRGTLNDSGERRRIIDIQVALQNTVSTDGYVSPYPLPVTFSAP